MLQVVQLLCQLWEMHLATLKKIYGRSIFRTENYITVIDCRSHNVLIS